jgi:2-polyprenyl-3-methyl-5-hydroxy-6-metoxy-1,4-benzoquinol methylase
MASIETNKQWWNESSWSEAGNEWSSGYGTPAMQWHASILPRIHRYLPAATILEIAPGFGRWTHYLKDACREMFLVDLSEKCITACQERFRSEKHLRYHVNDGTSLAMIPPRSVDFLFSYDSLVHVEADVIRAYLEQLPTILAPEGVAFIHHSNLGAFASYFAALDRLPRGRGLLSRWGLVEAGDHKRGRSMTADVFLSQAKAANLQVVSQELVNWGTRRPIDCISVVTRPNSKWDCGYRRWVNLEFAREAEYIRKIASQYDRVRPVET